VQPSERGKDDTEKETLIFIINENGNDQTLDRRLFVYPLARSTTQHSQPASSSAQNQRKLSTRILK
jgi:hypothetical protein